MCEFCEPKEIKNGWGVGKEICLYKTASDANIRDVQIMYHKNECPALMVFDTSGRAMYMDISYCPLCGKRLEEGPIS